MVWYCSSIIMAIKPKIFNKISKNVCYLHLQLLSLQKILKRLHVCLKLQNCKTAKLQNCKTKHFLLKMQMLTLFFLLSFVAKAQTPIDLAPFQVADGWYRINGGLDISPADFLRDYRSYWGLTPQDEIRLHKTESDSLGNLHYRYKQFYHGYAVEHTDFFLSYQDSLLVE